MKEDSILLREAMNAEKCQYASVWSIEGKQIHIDNVPDKLIVKETFVHHGTDEKYQVGFIGKKSDGTPFCTITKTFSSLDEVEKVFPELFKKEGEFFYLA